MKRVSRYLNYIADSEWNTYKWDSSYSHLGLQHTRVGRSAPICTGTQLTDHHRRFPQMGWTSMWLDRRSSSIPGSSTECRSSREALICMLRQSGECFATSWHYCIGSTAILTSGTVPKIKQLQSPLQQPEMLLSTESKFPTPEHALC